MKAKAIVIDHKEYALIPKPLLDKIQEIVNEYKDIKEAESRLEKGVFVPMSTVKNKFTNSNI